MFQVHNSNLSPRVPLSHLKIRMITTMMRSLNFPTILLTIKSEISSTTSTPEKANLLLLTTNPSMVSNSSSSSSQFCIKAPQDLNTQSNISLQQPSVDNPHQFLLPLETLQAMVSVWWSTRTPVREMMRMNLKITPKARCLLSNSTKWVNHKFFISNIQWWDCHLNKSTARGR